MPVDAVTTQVIYQREAYRKSWLTRLYWDYKDNWLIAAIPKDARFVVDLGCGEGIMLDRLFRRFPDRKVRGYDLNDENVRICREYGLPAEKGDVCALPVPDGTIDCALFIEVIEHMPNYREALSAISRLLKPGGTLIVMYPNDRVFRFLRTLLLRFKDAKQDYGHVFQCTPATLKAAASDSGFRQMRSRFLPFLFWPVSLHGVSVFVKKE